MRYVLANWKMNTTPAEAVHLAGQLADGLDDLAHGRTLPTTILLAPFTVLSAVGDVVESELLHLGAQDAHWTDKTEYTGEVSADMLKGLAEYVVLGHPERRLRGETDEQVAQKVAAVTAAGLKPIICVGEQTEDEDAVEVATDHLRAALEEVNPKSLVDTLVMYEPFHATTADRPIEAPVVEEVVDALKETAADLGLKNTSVVYGGGVTEQTVPDLARITQLDGIAIGSGSLNVQHLLSIIREASV